MKKEGRKEGRPQSPSRQTHLYKNVIFPLRKRHKDVPILPSFLMYCYSSVHPFFKVVAAAADTFYYAYDHYLLVFTSFLRDYPKLL